MPCQFLPPVCDYFDNDDTVVWNVWWIGTNILGGRLCVTCSVHFMNRLSFLSLTSKCSSQHLVFSRVISCCFYDLKVTENLCKVLHLARQWEVHVDGKLELVIWPRLYDSFAVCVLGNNLQGEVPCIGRSQSLPQTITHCRPSWFYILFQFCNRSVIKNVTSDKCFGLVDTGLKETQGITPVSSE